MTIQPLGDQLIIKVIPQESWKGIIIPDSAKGPTITGDKGAEDAVHFVEAEVVAVGPGKRGYDSKLVQDLYDALGKAWDHVLTVPELDMLLARKNHTRIPLTVKAGDRILYHPAVQKFDRKVEGLGEGEYFIIGEHSVLAVIE